MAKRKKLWDRGESLDRQVEQFTVGNDPELDLHLVRYDALASMAHATMLASIGIIKSKDLSPLRRELKAIAKEALQGTFVIARDEEDGHTAIENRLTERLGDLGKRIHTGRSRNDQIIAALRLYGREQILVIVQELLTVVETLLRLAQRYRATVMPGYTHTRQAMPTTVGHLFAAHAENLLDDVLWLNTAFTQLNRSPLGSASGFGVALALDRRLVAELLGFDTVQENTLAVQSDRGKTEMLVLSALFAPAHDLARLASDVIFFSTEELGYFELAKQTTTGSSIMPQKRNPDLWELIRASAATLRGYQVIVSGISPPLISGYHRDLQLTKEPFIRGMTLVADTLRATQAGLSGLTVNATRCKQALLSSIGATDDVYRRVAQGEAFRVAYQVVASRFKGRRSAKTSVTSQQIDPSSSWKLRKHLGAPGALDLKVHQQRLKDLRRWRITVHEQLKRVPDNLFK